MRSPVVYYQPLSQVPRAKCPLCNAEQTFYPRHGLRDDKLHFLRCKECNQDYEAQVGLARVVVTTKRKKVR